MLADISIFIAFLKGDVQVRNYLEDHSDIKIVNLTLMEAITYLPSQEKIAAFEDLLKSAGISVISAVDINDEALKIFKSYHHLYKISITHAFNVAMAKKIKQPILTKNKSPYQYIPELEIITI